MLYHIIDMEVDTYASNKDGGFYVEIPKQIRRDANMVLVRPGRVHGTHKITKHLEVPIDIWREVTSQVVIEGKIIAWNRQHLQDTKQEKGVT